MNENTPGTGSVPDTSWVVGSAEDCQLLVAKPSVSSHHCRLSRYGDAFVLEDLGSTNGTFVNGHRLGPNAPVYVSASDAITLGRNTPLPWPQARVQPVVHPVEKNGKPVAGVITVGRGPDNAVQLDYPMISWNHARIVPDTVGWYIEDLGSANGTALNRIDNKIRVAPLEPGDDIFFGSFKIAASQILMKKHLTQGEGAFELVQLRGNSMVVGRDPGCDYPLQYPMISWRHARLERTANGIYAEDLGSRNGTYVNGVRISGKTLVKPGQEIGLGTFRFQLREDGAFAKREYTGNVTIEVSSVVVNAPNGTRLLDPVSLTIYPSELIALMGPAGAGKTTFLKALNGYTPPAAGRVLFNGADLYQFYDRFRQQMSYVPQDDIVHAQLTVREALYFSARLRTDLGDDEIEKRIDQILKSLGIDDKKNAIIGSPERKVLSGGQRKRVNIAMELIADTPVIFLDEPTSGLSSYDAEEVIRLLKKLATEGKTIVTTIHQPSLDIYREFDSLIMISRDRGGCGALAYFGPAYPDSIEFFNPDVKGGKASEPAKELSPEMLLSGLKGKVTADWATTYEQSEYKTLFVNERSGKIPSTPGAQTAKAGSSGFGFAQWQTLVHRNFLLKLRDKAQLIILLIQAPLFGLLVGAVFGHVNANANYAQFQQQVGGLEFLMVVAAIWFGCNNAARDIVGEWTVYQRERMVSLKLGSYLFSKFFVSAVLGLFQCLVLLGIVTLMCKPQGNFAAQFGVLYLSSLVGAAMGLCVSARSGTTEAAIAMLPLILLPVISLGGGIWPIYQMQEPLPQLAKVVPSRWAFNALEIAEAKAEPLSKPIPNSQIRQDVADQAFPTGKRSALKTCWLVLGGMLVGLLGLALVFLRMRDVH